MDRILVTIGGHPVYPKGETPDLGPAAAHRDARDAAGRLRAITEMSPSGWASGGNEDTLEAGLPFMGVLVAVILFTVAALVLAKRGR